MQCASRFLDDRTASIATTTALVISVLAAIVAFTVDTGGLFYLKRKQQGVTDLAALAAASNLGTATAAATTAVSANGFAPGDVATVEVGTYTADPTLAPSQRFQPSTTAPPNAARVTLKKVQPYLFGWFASAQAQTSPVSTSSGGGTMMTTRAVAATNDLGAFAVGSGLASLDGGIANAVLGSLLGTNLSLSAMDYQSLASANIDLFAFSNALATRLGDTAGTYTQLATWSTSLPTALRAVADVAPTAQAIAALTQIAAALGGQTGTVQLGNLLSVGPYGFRSVGSASPLTETVNALNLVSAIAEIANGQQQVETPLTVNLPGIASASLKLAIGAPPVGTSLATVGAAGATLNTAQMRFRLDLQIGGPPPANVMAVPLTFNIAYATATLNSVQCSRSNPSTDLVTLGVTPGIVDAWIGTVSDQTLANLAVPLNPPPATLVNLVGLLTITGQGHAMIGNTAPTYVSFTYADILAANGKTVSTTDYLSPLVASLFGSLQLSVTAPGLPPLTASLLKPAAVQALTASATSIDAILASTLAVLGISVGNATVWATGVQCGQSVLVN